MKTVHEVSELTGVSVRTLHYYDEIGLLTPTETTQAGYRLYGDAALARLQQILFLRELDFPLKEIKAILQSGSFDAREAMEHQKHLLVLKRDRLDKLIGLADSFLKGETTMNFEAFDMKEIEQARTEYAQEAKERWGSTEAYRQSEARTSKYTQADWQRISGEMDGIFAKFAAQMDKPLEDPAVQQTVRAWQDHITTNYYNCTDEILAGLGEMYTADERFRTNIDRHAAGLAAFISQAIRAYCRQ